MRNSADPAETKKRVLGYIDRDEVVRIARDLVDIPSPTGYEKRCADYIIERYKAAGLKVLPQEFDEERVNAIGILKGNGTGPRLMLNGHMDTSYVGDEQYLPDQPGYKPKAVIDGDWIYGLGIYNMKGGLAAFIHAVEAVKKAGVELAGDVVVACVAGEIEKSQVDRYQGQLYRGGACGTWYAITHGAVADFAVVGEPSGMTLMRAHGGYVWTRITLLGDPKHTVFGRVEDNTINNMLKIAQRVQAWGDDYAKRCGYLDMPAKVTLSAIEGGWPYRCSRVPVYCTLYVDTRLMPGQSPLQVQRELETLVARIQQEDPDIGKLHLDMNLFMTQWGSECSSDELIYQEMTKAHEEVLGAPPDVTAVPFASDACELVAHGIPALNYGPSGRTRQLATGAHYGKAQSDWNPQQGEHLSIDDLYNTTRVYAALILNVCRRTRKELGIQP
jgi:acetylornithine deacetylase